MDYPHYQRCYTVDKGILDSCVEARRFVSVEIYTFSIFSRGININRVVARLAKKVEEGQSNAIKFALNTFGVSDLYGSIR